MKNHEAPLKLNLQHFAEPTPPADPPTPQTVPTTTQNAPVPVDYDKIAQILEGKQSATEDSVLKGYFKQQGLSQDEMAQAITTFKQQKAASQPDVNALQTQAQQATVALQQAKVENAATLAALGLGLDVKTIPYVLKMADLSQSIGQDGKVNEETLKSALNKVLEDVPALKPQTSGAAGFVQVGASGQQQNNNQEDLLKGIFGIKK